MKLRIVSLVPAATEIICALGGRSRLVGRSHECDFPEQVRALPVVTSSKVDPTAPGGEIDRSVKEVAAAGGSLYRIDAALLSELKPDVIVTQADCAVCAVTEADLNRALETHPDPKPRIVALNVNRFADLWQAFAVVAGVLGFDDGGRSGVSPLKERVAEVATRVATGVTKRPSVLALEWLDPLMSGGNWLPELIELAGGSPVLARAGAHSPWIDWQAVVARNPDVIVLLPCGFGLERARGEAVALTARPEWNRLKAVRSGRVFVCDGNALFNRPGPRLVDSLECMAEMLHPAHFPARHRGPCWQPLQAGLRGAS